MFKGTNWSGNWRSPSGGHPRSNRILPMLPIISDHQRSSAGSTELSRLRMSDTPSPSLRTAAVFGASGKLGRRVLTALRDRGLAIRALIHRTPVDAAGVTSITGDIADPRAVAAVIEGADVVVHLATAKEDTATFFDASI